MVSLRHVDQDVLARRAEAAAAKKAAKEAAKEAAKAAKEAAKEVSQPPAKDGASAPTPPRKQAAGKGNSVSLASLRDKLHRGRSKSGNKDGRNGSKVVKGGKFHDDFMDTDDDSTVVPEVQKETDDDETVLPEENGQQEKGTDDDETVLPEENGQEENTTAQEDDSKDDSNYVPDDEDLEQYSKDPQVTRIVLKFSPGDKKKGIELSNKFFQSANFDGDYCQPKKIATLSKTGDTNRTRDGSTTDQLQVTTTVSWKLVNLKSEREYGAIQKKKEEKEEEEFDISGIDLNADDG